MVRDADEKGIDPEVALRAVGRRYRQALLDVESERMAPVDKTVPTGSTGGAAGREQEW